MLILGIETSCDETAAAVVKNGREVLSNVISSQIDLHAKTGGVVPEVASREHALKIIPVIDEALKQAKIKLQNLGAIAVAKGPGLIGCLLIGANAASTLALISDKPLIPINHVSGHIYANWLNRTEKNKFPSIILTVSGGHNEIVLMRDYNKFKVLGETRDDAAGEAFDKVAKLLHLGYPGGPAISKAALSGDPHKFKLPRAYLEKDGFDFSFSGLKTAVLRLVEKNNRPDQKFINDVAASFQEAVCDILTDKLIAAADKYQVKEVHLSGGVSANSRLREMLKEKLTKIKSSLILRFPDNIQFCTDNAAMIAAAGYFKFKTVSNKYKKWKNVIADSSFDLK